MDGAVNPTVRDTSTAMHYAGHILRLAIHGLAVRQSLPEQGLPAMPVKTAYMPVFIRLFHRPDWMEQITDLTQAGMDSHKVDSEVQEAIKRGLIEPGMQHFLVDDLAYLSGL